MPESITREPTLAGHSSITETQVNRAFIANPYPYDNREGVTR